MIFGFCGWGVSDLGGSIPLREWRVQPRGSLALSRRRVGRAKGRRTPADGIRCGAAAMARGIHEDY